MPQTQADEDAGPERDQDGRVVHEPGPGSFEMQDGDRAYMPKVTVRLTVRDPEGEVKSETESTSFAANLATDNWVTCMVELHKFAAIDSGTTADLNDDNNDTRTLRFWHDDESDHWMYMGGSRGPRIAIGDGSGSSVTPARDNWRLDGELRRENAGAPDRGEDNVTIARTFQNNTGSSWTVRETGVFFNLEPTDNIDADFLMFHDSVADETVADGEQITVEYEFDWP